VVIEFVDVSYQYDIPGDEWALSGIHLKIEQGEKIVIAGPAGSGKTTLLQLLDALILPTRGEIFYDGISVHTLARHNELPSVRRRMGVLFQFPEEQFFQERAYDELVFALRNFFGPDEPELERRAREVTQGFGLDLARLKTCSPFTLSSGEKRKLALASALMIRPQVLMLDEPTAGLDASGRRELMRLIASLEETTVIIVTHNQEDFLALAHRIVGISRGNKVLDVQKADLLQSIDLLESHSIEAPLVVRVRHWLRQEGVIIDGAPCEMEELLRTLAGMVPPCGKG
jgi:energy-coupling factor transport system ATP-binding protein